MDINTLKTEQVECTTEISMDDSDKKILSRWEILTRNADIPWRCIVPALWEYDDAVTSTNLINF
jgi:hypothetical protein